MKIIFFFFCCSWHCVYITDHNVTYLMQQLIKKKKKLMLLERNALKNRLMLNFNPTCPHKEYYTTMANYYCMYKFYMYHKTAPHFRYPVLNMECSVILKNQHKSDLLITMSLKWLITSCRTKNMSKINWPFLPHIYSLALPHKCNGSNAV